MITKNISMLDGLTTELTGRYRSDQGERERTAERLSKRLTRRGSVRVERLVRPTEGPGEQLHNLEVYDLLVFAIHDRLEQVLVSRVR